MSTGVWAQLKKTSRIHFAHESCRRKNVALQNRIICLQFFPNKYSQMSLQNRNIFLLSHISPDDVSSWILAPKNMFVAYTQLPVCYQCILVII